MISTTRRIRLLGFSIHKVCGNSAAFSAFLTPLLDLISPSAGTYSMAAAGIFLTFATTFGLLDLLVTSIPPKRQYFLVSHIAIGFAIALVIGYAYSRWQGDTLPAGVLVIDTIVALLVGLQWWLGRKIVHRTALASLFNRQA